MNSFFNLTRPHLATFCKIRTNLNAVRTIADSNDGSKIDDNNAIMKAHGSDMQAFDKYFEDKEDAIKNSLIRDTMTGVLDDSNVTEAEIHQWRVNMETKLEELHAQKSDLLDLYEERLPIIGDNFSDLSDRSSESPSSSEQDSSEEDSEQASLSNNPPSFPQNS